MLSRRSAGVLLHPTSLPGGWGIGDLGDGARAFLSWAETAHQRVWQVLPLGPTSEYNSPYDCPSAFAGNPMLISPTELASEGLLPSSALADAGEGNPDKVDFASVRTWKSGILRRSWRHFTRHAPPLTRMELEGFREDPAQSSWLADWSLFCALKERHEGRAWNTWDDELRRRDPQALATARRELAEEIAYHGYLQFLFFRQWSRVKEEAGRRGVRILGDVPIYVALDSADVWAHAHLFTLDQDGRPETVAGVPPDYFSATGQRWGNPLYRWDRVADDGYAWWVERLRMTLRLADLIRIDHFRGFAGYWEIPASEPTAIHGRWVEGPGRRLFDAIRQALGDLPIIAEDLGVVTEDVVELRRSLGLPGMKVMQFGFGEPDNEHLPHNYAADTVAFTGTHDNDTTAGWFAAASEAERLRATEYLGSGPDDIAWGMIRAVYTSVAPLVITPLQDILGLGSEARMNRPSKSEGNWAWRVRREELDSDLARRLARLVSLTGR